MAITFEPFLKWAGGKRWLVRHHHDLFPEITGRYIEPFLGSGAVFFHLQPKFAVLADRNDELIETYKEVRKNPAKLSRLLKRYQRLHSPSFYYKIRASIPSDSTGRAARFIYLNRVCFNGLYRVNLQGEFNVPIGSKNVVEFPEGFLEKISTILKNARILHSDFESVLADAEPGDFIFVDPPYTVSHNNNGFIKYNDVLFSWDDQIRLAKAVKKAAERGAKVLVSNADHDAIKQLYADFCFHHRLSRSSILSASAESRRRTSESAFLNYSQARQN